MRRQQLTEAQIAALFDPPTDRRELVRHCTLSEADIAMIRRCRGDHSRLGYALMLLLSPLSGTAHLTDQAIDLFDRLVGAMFSKGRVAARPRFQADGRAINERFAFMRASAPP